MNNGYPSNPVSPPPLHKALLGKSALAGSWGIPLSASLASSSSVPLAHYLRSASSEQSNGINYLYAIGEYTPDNYEDWNRTYHLTRPPPRRKWWRVFGENFYYCFGIRARPINIEALLMEEGRLPPAPPAAHVPPVAPAGQTTGGTGAPAGKKGLKAWRVSGENFCCCFGVKRQTPNIEAILMAEGRLPTTGTPPTAPPPGPQATTPGTLPRPVAALKPKGNKSIWLWVQRTWFPAV
ncbi:hypothetical protein BDV39DRAFT_204409 [Aspergillus sergii]|uniref:Uncharacterized protein n=1 Tax=Aspergillus sergii TaxID=1034303 RepID=A0A5N6X599_9EURO|nr:hypothetical protein BDV39DRAFT_204409 [Aspergillus sergii]